MTFLILKLLCVTGLLLYVIFAGIILRQTQLMAHTVEEGAEPVLKLLAIIHLVSAIGVMILAIILL